MKEDEILESVKRHLKEAAEYGVNVGWYYDPKRKDREPMAVVRITHRLGKECSVRTCFFAPTSSNRSGAPSAMNESYRCDLCGYTMAKDNPSIIGHICDNHRERIEGFLREFGRNGGAEGKAIEVIRKMREMTERSMA